MWSQPRCLCQSPGGLPGGACGSPSWGLGLPACLFPWPLGVLGGGRGWSLPQGTDRNGAWRGWGWGWQGSRQVLPRALGRKGASALGETSTHSPLGRGGAFFSSCPSKPPPLSLPCKKPPEAGDVLSVARGAAGCGGEGGADAAPPASPPPLLTICVDLPGGASPSKRSWAPGLPGQALSEVLLPE